MQGGQTVLLTEQPCSVWLDADAARLLAAYMGACVATGQTKEACAVKISPRP